MEKRAVCCSVKEFKSTPLPSTENQKNKNIMEVYNHPPSLK